MRLWNFTFLFSVASNNLNFTGIMKIFFFLFLFFISITSNVFSQTTHDKMLERLASLNGNWKGYLEYLDYSDGKTKVKLPATCEAAFNKSGNDKYLFTKFVFDEGKGRTVTGEDAWTILDEKTFFFDSTNFAITKFDDNTDNTIFIFEREWMDNNKPCIIKETFTIKSDYFSILKQVRYKEETDFFTRHEYVFNRVK